MHRKFPILALAFLPLLLAACEQKTATTPPPPTPKPAAAAPAPVASGPSRTIGFELVGPQSVGALQFDVKYAGEGRFVGDKDAVACETKIDGALSSFNHIVEEKNLRSAFVAVKGFAGPVRVSECKFQGAAKVEDFTVTVRDSSTPELGEVTPAPVIKVVLD